MAEEEKELCEYCEEFHIDADCKEAQEIGKICPCCLEYYLPKEPD